MTLEEVAHDWAVNHTRNHCPQHLKALVDAWLAGASRYAPPADDGDPVTTDWFVARGAIYRAESGIAYMDSPGEVSLVWYPLGVTTGEPQLWLWNRELGGFEAVEPTRGNVRRLVQALKLKGSHDGRRD